MKWGEWQEDYVGPDDYKLVYRFEGEPIPKNVQHMTAARANAYVACAEALKRLDAALFFEHTVRTEDWGLYLDEAILEMTEIYNAATQALAALEGAADA